jgi:NADPH:quinone reductase-like Zn-dependent oxidoreductase
MFLERDRYQLDVLRMMLEREQIKPVIDSVLPLGDVAEAHRRLEAGGVKGKLVLRVREE